jgi:hypothetical protein
MLISVHFFSVCDMQTDPKVSHVKCLIEGAVYKELGEEEMAVQVCVCIVIQMCIYSYIDVYV